MFESLLSTVESIIASKMFRVQLGKAPVMKRPPQNMVEQKDDIHEELSKEVADATVPKAAPTSTSSSKTDFASALSGAKGITARKPEPGEKHIKIGRNDPCPCGSGKKYKKCGLINASSHRG